MDLNDIPAQAIIVLVAMIIGAIKWFLEQVAGNKAGQDAVDQAEDDFEDLYEEARREIQERQTQHPQPEAQPTPPPTPQPVLVRTSPTPQATPTPPPLPDWERKVSKPSLSAAEKQALARFQKQSAHPRKKRQVHQGSRVRQLLSSPSSARDAIVLAEILGPPKGAHGN